MDEDTRKIQIKSSVCGKYANPDKAFWACRLHRQSLKDFAGCEIVLIADAD